MNSTTRLLVVQTLLNRLKKRARKGFTLIELLVVVVIIGILASVALPSFVGAQDKARNAGVQANINTIRMGLEQYATDNNGSYPTFGIFATAGLFLTNNYIPGNTLPRSPWSKAAQTSSIVPVAPEILAGAIANGSPLPPLGTQLAAGGAVSVTNPTALIDYGAVEYDLDVGSQTYVVYGTGKKAKAAVTAAQVSNGGN
ncbi:MAG: N-terminal methylation motif protein [Cyanobacteria bacterium RYN_339]|nr:N-terminal methylation motif protein [Cyanobacteria bacterium RYN_339]